LENEIRRRSTSRPDLDHLQAIAKRYKTAAKLLDDVALDPSDAIEAALPGGAAVLLLCQQCIQRKA
jgi:hypothetical protein